MWPKRLEVSRPSVTRMLNVLTEKGLTEKARYGKIALTPAGERVAERCVCQIERMARLLPQTGLRLTPSELRRAAAAMAGALPRDVSWTKTKKRRMDSASFFRAREGVAGSRGLCYA